MEISVDLVLQTAVIGLCLGVVVLVLNRLRSSKEEDVQKKHAVSNEKEKRKQEYSQQGKQPAVKKKQEKWVPRDSKQAFAHPWMLTSLKGHTGEVLDMDFSSNGKFLATCADDVDAASTEDGSPGDRSGNSSSSEGNKENSCPPDGGGGGTPRAAVRSRRQKKNASPGKKNKAKAKRAAVNEGGSKQSQNIPLRQRAKLKLTDQELAHYFRHYVLSPDQLLGLSFPVESTLYPGRAILYKSPSNRPQQAAHQPPARQSHLFDVNAQEFVPRHSNPHIFSPAPNVPQPSELSESIYVSSSLVKSWKDGSSDSDSTKSEDFVQYKPEKKDETKISPVKSKAQEELSGGSDEKCCVRCGRGFFVSTDGEYLTQEKCLYHWGKLQIGSNGVSDYSCCKGRSNTKGCTTGKLHVWKGINDGINGPLDGFVRTRPRKTPPPDGNYGVYSLDCEMCFTTRGLELTKVTVVGTDGRLVYDCLVRPENYIIDYNTRFSGITAKDLSKKGATKSLKDVQNDLMGFINADTILIGHGLENDLRALRIIHGTVIDTSVVFPHYYGLPYRRSLKSLANCLLKRDIQSDSSGHDSYEDALACVELMLWRVRKEFRSVLEPRQCVGNQ